jgi:hypothetical protein
VSDNPQTFTAWITDARLLQKEGGGIRMLRAQVREQGSSVVYDYNSDTYRLASRDEGRIWHRTREAAVARAIEMRNARIDSLGRQIGRLWKMEF